MRTKDDISEVQDSCGRLVEQPDLLLREAHLRVRGQGNAVVGCVVHVFDVHAAALVQIPADAGVGGNLT